MLYKGNTNGKVHRIVYALITGEDITGLVVRHICDNPLCVNPDHLLAGTHIDNMCDRRERGRVPHQVFNVEKVAVFSLRKAGMSYKDIAHLLNIKHKRVDYILNRLGG